MPNDFSAKVHVNLLVLYHYANQECPVPIYKHSRVNIYPFPDRIDNDTPIFNTGLEPKVKLLNMYTF